MKMTNKNFSSREEADKWIADIFGTLGSRAANQSYQNQLGASQKQQVPDPALKPGTIITDRCYIVDENGRLWLMDPHDGTIDWLQSPNG